MVDVENGETQLEKYWRLTQAFGGVVHTDIDGVPTEVTSSLVTFNRKRRPVVQMVEIRVGPDAQGITTRLSLDVATGANVYPPAKLRTRGRS